jgi:Tfp pilus assembly protein PilP
MESSVSTSILKSIAKYAFIIAVPLFLISCGDDAANSGSLKATAKMPVPKKAKPVKKAAESKAVRKISKVGEADVRVGLRNPFQSYITQEVTTDDRVLGPLECCELGLFRLMAVISGIDNSRALIMAPDGQKYITKKGDIMGLRGGKITKIYKNKIVVEEKHKDPSGKKMLKELVEIKLPSDEKKKIR